MLAAPKTANAPNRPPAQAVTSRENARRATTSGAAAISTGNDTSTNAHDLSLAASPVPRLVVSAVRALRPNCTPELTLR